MNPSKYYQAFGLLMREAPNQDHYDSGCDGICPECRTCRYHRPFWRHQTCVFEYCPYGRLRKAYLKMHRPILFNELVLSDKLFEHCAEIDEAARNRMELIVRSLAEQNGVTEQLKAENQMEWVRQMNACKAQAEEVVKAELIYN